VDDVAVNVELRNQPDLRSGTEAGQIDQRHRPRQSVHPALPSVAPPLLRLLALLTDFPCQSDSNPVCRSLTFGFPCDISSPAPSSKRSVRADVDDSFHHARPAGEVAGRHNPGRHQCVSRSRVFIGPDFFAQINTRGERLRHHAIIELAAREYDSGVEKTFAVALMQLNLKPSRIYAFPLPTAIRTLGEVNVESYPDALKLVWCAMDQIAPRA
jgi:hypothetical protein